MRFNRNIYSRLYYISFFICEKVYQKHGVKPEKSIYDSPYEDENLPIISVIFDRVNITDFEIKLFEVCSAVYDRLDDIFLSYQEIFRAKGRPRDVPEMFYKELADKIHNDDKICEASFGMFKTVKSACYFYCKFMPSYFLFKYSVLIFRAKQKIPFMKFIKNELYSYYYNYIIPEKDAADDVNREISVDDLSCSIELFLKKFSNVPQDEILLKDVDNIIIQSINIQKYLVSTSKQKSTISDKEKNRRNKISKSKKESSQKRSAMVQKIIDTIQAKYKSKESTKMVKLCQDYFNKNREKLKDLNINSPRTLQNLCSRCNPNRQRKIFSERVNDSMGKEYLYPKYFISTIESIKNKFQEETNYLSLSAIEQRSNLLLQK